MNIDDKDNVGSLKDFLKYDDRVTFYPEGYWGDCTPITIKKQPYVCPVCHGKGIVPNGFYNSTGNVWVVSTTAPEKCRSCNGTGVVWG